MAIPEEAVLLLSQLLYTQLSYLNMPVLILPRPSKTLTELVAGDSEKGENDCAEMRGSLKIIQHVHLHPSQLTDFFAAYEKAMDTPKE
jgi:hypothetical protein